MRRAREDLRARPGPALPLLVALALFTSIPAPAGEHDAPAGTKNRPEAGSLSISDDRAIAIGLLLDSPRPSEVSNEALALSEKLRRKYGIDTGNPFDDREKAARLAQTEFVDRLVFDESEIQRMAEALGYTLDPEKCVNWCDNVRELATIELQRTALRAFADGKPWPGRLSEEAMHGQSESSDSPASPRE